MSDRTVNLCAKLHNDFHSQVISQSITLAFVSYPTAVLEMDVPPLWSFLFFFMLINLALSSICGGIQTFVAFMIEEKPSLAKKRIHVLVLNCVMFFLVAVSMTTNGGIHLFTVFDKRCTASLLCITLLSVIVVSYFYGMDKFIGNLKEMGIKMPPWLAWIWKIMLWVVTPGILAFVTVYSWIKSENMKWNDEYQYPASVQAVGNDTKET